MKAAGRTSALVLVLMASASAHAAPFRPCATKDKTTIESNRTVQYMHRVDLLKGVYRLSGYGITVGVWETSEGFGTTDPSATTRTGVQTTHPEFFPQRVDSYYPANQKPPKLSNHATAVAGAIGAAGICPLVQGMAPDVRIHARDSTNAVDELKRDTSVTISNHSYGPTAGWEAAKTKLPEVCKNAAVTWSGPRGTTPEQEASGKDIESLMFGLYDGSAWNYDRIAFERPDLSVFVSAGNERDEDFRPSQANNYCERIGLQQKWFAPTGRTPDADGEAGGFDSLPLGSSAKNVILVGAIDTKFNATNFSSAGPTDDGRIKPDVVAFGDKAFTTYDVNGGYAGMNGTSIATPFAAGAAALLNQLAKRKLKRTLYSDEMKVALIHTARPATATGAPNYATGWGAIDAYAAGQLVAGDHGRLVRLCVGDVVPRVLSLRRVRQSPSRISVVWIDRPGTPPEGDVRLDDRTAELVDDIDLKLTSPSGHTLYAWSLDPERPVAAARRGGYNRVDNVERIDVPADAVEDGEWRLTIKLHSQHAGRDRLEVALALTGFTATAEAKAAIAAACGAP